MLCICKLLYIFILFFSCAQITNEKGYSHFGIQNIGDCMSGFNVSDTFASQGARLTFTNQGPRPWVGCLGKDGKRCKRPSLNCVGQDQTNFVYGLKNSKCDSCIYLFDHVNIFNSFHQMINCVPNLNFHSRFINIKPILLFINKKYISI